MPNDEVKARRLFRNVERILISRFESCSQRKTDLVRITRRPSASISSQLPNTDLQHHLYALSLEGVLGLAPPNLKESTLNRVLDVGTGTGIWAIDFGKLSRLGLVTKLKFHDSG
jgi:hypothetical protein